MSGARVPDPHLASYRHDFPYSAAALGSAYVLAGRVDMALTTLHEAGRCAHPTHTWCSLGPAEARLHAGRAEEARQVAEQSLATAKRVGERATSARGLWLLGEIAARSAPADPTEPVGASRVPTKWATPRRRAKRSTANSQEMLAAFIGFQLAGVPGAAVATSAIYLPSFLMMLSILPLLRRMKDLLRLKAFMRGVGPAVVGTLASR